MSLLKNNFSEKYKSIFFIIILLITVILFFRYFNIIKNRKLISEKNKSISTVSTVSTEWIEKKISLLDTLPLYDPINDLYLSFDKYRLDKEKIVVYIDGECFSCVEDFIGWKKIADKLNYEKTDTEFLFYLHITDVEIVKPYLKRWRFQYPIIIDTKNTFQEKNNIIRYDKLYHAMLLDKDNKVQIMGNPLYNEKIKEQYFLELIQETTH